MTEEETQAMRERLIRLAMTRAKSKAQLTEAQEHDGTVREMVAEAMREAREIGLPDTEMARIFGINRRTVRQYRETGKADTRWVRKAD